MFTRYAKVKTKDADPGGIPPSIIHSKVSCLLVLSFLSLVFSCHAFVSVFSVDVFCSCYFAVTYILSSLIG